MTDLGVDTEQGNESVREDIAASTVGIWGIGTATPAGDLSQAEAIGLTGDFSCDTDGQRAWLRRVFSRAGVDRRGTVLMNGQGLADVKTFYGPRDHEGGPGAKGPTTGTRMDRYAAEAPALAERAARGALLDALQDKETAEGASNLIQRVTHLMTVSCTGFFAPGLDVALIGRLGLRPNVKRLHVGFMGCHAGFNALGAAREAVLAARAAGKEAVVLVVCVELCTLHFAYGWQPEKLVANALFADGAAACVVGEGDTETGRLGNQEHEAWRILETASLLLPDSRDAMTWRVGDHGFEMTLSSELPVLIGTHVRGWCEHWLAAAGVKLSDIPNWAIHPGGPKILSAAMSALGLAEKDVENSRGVLARHGNLSSATLMFLLKGLRDAGARGKCVAIGFGPGLMAEGMLLER